jgi:polyphosphate kinase 2
MSKHDESESREKLSRKEYEAEMSRLQVELVRIQNWLKASGARVIVVFEGRDAAGKGGTIRCLTERTSPRVFRTIALPAPTEREKSQMYLQRYIPHFPAGGEMSIFDRSWYNRAGVERVMGFCTPEEVETFLTLCPLLERQVVRSGIHLIKYFLDVGQEEQERRFYKRIEDPLRQWKLSPMDLTSYEKWWEYTAAYDRMIEATDTEWAPWYVVKSDDKRRARLNCIAHLIDTIPYEKVKVEMPKLPPRKEREKKHPKTIGYKNVVPSRY